MSVAFGDGNIADQALGDRALEDLALEDLALGDRRGDERAGRADMGSRFREPFSWKARAPAAPGMRVGEVDTPALVLDLAAYERNLDKMAGIVSRAGKRLRPHAKMHKTPRVAFDQIRRGAVGVCCQKVSEAEVMAAAGITDILITNEVVTPAKLERVAELALGTALGVCVDDASVARALSSACAAAGAQVRVLVEIDVGGHRAGLSDPAAAAGLAAVVEQSPHLVFGGLQAYHGSAQHKRTVEERRATINEAAALVRRTIAELGRLGIACPVVTGGGTGTLFQDIDRPEWTELQCGSYAFMDADYGRNELEGGVRGTGFEHSLFVHTTVMSTACVGRASADAGLKAVASDSGAPLIVGRPDLSYNLGSDEHGTIALTQGASLMLGERLALVPGHCDPTVNLHDWIVAVRDGVVEQVWEVAARGALT
ncbi:DSD1 family PLP-dependent enzyme [Chelatococcus asaccharovorans]|uniref:D-serine deaminase-like pyridoxal phosphate-dependent protein n=1 Tax=Chelatococcus asaccharovorans TaxID=28210 RepID=A0A2V3UJF4_9HYPH|nr:DSD1 family PLP-dependent enzyme [Chelatococcus asaccharovorans]PXW64424.1 D-serine deaminase-like pyridoxal phosphate-dependent protein [Chelatococcus asaccharovorans]